MIALLLGLALAQDVHPVRTGDTPESIAEDLGDPTLAPRIRALNRLGATAALIPGTLLRLPLIGNAVAQDAFLLTLRGTATVTEAGGEPRPIRRFGAVRSGDLLCTGRDSFATLRVATQCTDDGHPTDDLTLGPDTCVELVGAASDGDRRSTAVRVRKGSLQVQENPDGHGHVTVRAGDGQTTGERGGYRVTVEDAAMRAEALYAAVAIQGAGQQVDLDAGQGSRVRAGQAPEPPVDLLRPGTPVRPEDGAALRRPAFLWTSADDAFGYRFEVATGPDFVDLVYQDDVVDPDYRPSMLLLPWPDDGLLYWRIASFDRFGFLGIPSAPRAMRLPSGAATP